ncbi:MAG TPA: hypothetical protein VGM63_18595 [Mucilaginibacter sp.]
MINISQKLKDQIWWMIISVDYDYSRISVADHELNDGILTLWLEDKHDFKNSLEECLQLDISARQFAKIVRGENLNSYEGTKMHPTKQFLTNAASRLTNPSVGTGKMLPSSSSNGPVKRL